MADSSNKRQTAPTIVKHPLAPIVIKDGKLSAKSAQTSGSMTPKSGPG
jgi:hypothetical protein